MQTGFSGVTDYRRISSDIGMFPYKIEIDQQLHKDDFEKWFEMAEQLIPILQDPVWNKKLYCSDENTFYLSGQVHITAAYRDIKIQQKFSRFHFKAKKLMFGAPFNPITLLGHIFSTMQL